MTDYDHTVTVNHNRLHKSVLLDALRNIVDLPLIMLFCVGGIRHNIRKPPLCDFHAFLLFCHQPPPLGYSNSLSPPMRPSGSSQTWVTQFASRWQCLFHNSLLSGIAALPGRRYAICPRQRLSAFGAALQSCLALALQGKSPSLAVVSPYGAPMPHIGRLPA